jgi:hypothetical protein
MQIVSLVPEGAPSSLYRSFIPMQALALRGHRVHVEESNQLGDPRMLRDVDVVHIFRLFGPFVEEFARFLREEGVLVVWDFDFDIRSTPVDHPISQQLADRLPELISWMDGMARVADLVLCPTEELAARFRAQGAHAAASENLLPPTFERPRTLPERGLTSGWACGRRSRRCWSGIST